MNKRKFLIISLAAITMAVSCGSGGGSNSATSTATPVYNGGNNGNYNSGGNGNSAVGNTNNVGNIGNGNNTNTGNINNFVPGNGNINFVNPLTFDTYTNQIVQGTNNAPYIRKLGPVNSVDPKFNNNGEIQWNGDFSYNPENPENVSENLAYTGKGVKIGVIDSGLNDNSDYFKELKKNVKYLVKVSDSTSPSTFSSETIKFHGSAVTSVIADSKKGIAKNATILLADNTASNGIFTTEDNFKKIIDNGASIINISSGSEKNRTTAVKGENVLGTFEWNLIKEGINKGILFIYSAGNERKTTSSLQASVPYLEPEVEKVWLNVVGLSYKNRNHITYDYDDPRFLFSGLELNNLEPTTNAGGAKNWTITALGIRRYDYKNIVKAETGSSFAAPYVSGVAALIKEKYPFMDGSLLRQTILSTATDIGKPGVDDVYGWGLLNVDKALNGPALFDKRLALGDNVNITLDGGKYDFSNHISGDAGLNLQGNGTLTLSRGASYTGNTTIGSGAYLKVNGKLGSVQTKVLSSGVLELNNTDVTGNIQNNGIVLNSGNSNINVLESNGTLITDVNSKIATVKSDLNGEIILSNNNNQYFTKNGERKNIISGNVTGNAKVESENELLSVTPLINGSTTVRRIDTVDYAKNIGATVQEINTANQIETSLKNIDEQYESGKATEKVLSSASKLQTLNKTTLDTLSGQIYASAQALTFEQQENVNRNISNRISGLGDSIESNSNYSFWIDGAFSRGKIERDGFARGKTKVNSGIAGFEKKVGSNTMIGASIDYSNGKVKFDSYNGESKSNSAGVSIYGRQNLGNAYIGGRLGYSNVDSDVKRDIAINPYDWKQSSIKHTDNVYSAYIETGYDIKNEKGFTVTPYVGASYDKVKRGAFEEKESAYGLKADKKSYSMPSVSAGVKAKQTLIRDGGLKTTFNAYASYEKGLGNKNLDFEASYVNNPDAKFEVKGINMSRSKIKAGIGVEHEVTKNVALHLNYDLKKATDKNDVNHMVTTGFKVSF